MDHEKSVIVQTILVLELAEASSLAASASKELKAVMSDIPSGLPHPDGTHRIRNASQILVMAREELMRAHKRLNDFIEHGIVPEDLKRSG